ncbi:leucine-rich repeat domain-containing protein [Streptomyces atratus]|uniref:leucine-rich repeat domain-containing protein n=1 Tax=Streptomyces atratus TaxID=1893 RepID=UPI0036B2093D
MTINVPPGYRIIPDDEAQECFSLHDRHMYECGDVCEEYEIETLLYEDGLSITGDLRTGDGSDLWRYNVIIDGDLNVDGELQWADGDHPNLLLITGSLRTRSVTVSFGTNLIVRGDLIATYAVQHPDGIGEEGLIIVGGTTYTPVDIGPYTLVVDGGQPEEATFDYDDDLSEVLAPEVLIPHERPYRNGKADRDKIYEAALNGRPILRPTPETPPVLKQLAPDATDVDLTNQGITAIPKQVFNLSNLRRLALDGLSVSDRIGELTSLEELDLSETRLEELPATIGRLTQLRILRLYSPRLRSLPKQLGDLVNLQTLQLPYLSTPLPDSVERLRLLTDLDLSYLNYDRPAELPPVVNRLSALRRLSLANARLTGIPDDILALTSLEELDLTCSVIPRLDRLPDLAQLPLRILRFGGGSTPAQRHHLLGSVWPITTLEELYLDRWGEQKIGGRVVRPALTTLPDDAFTRTPRLRRLDLSFNELTTLPESLYGLTHLEYISLSHTKLDAATVDRLRKALPELHIDLNSPKRG